MFRPSAAKLRAFFGALSTLEPWMLGIERHRAGVQTTRRFRAVGEDASPKDSPRQGINAQPERPPPAYPASGQAKPRLEPTGGVLDG